MWSLHNFPALLVYHDSYLNDSCLPLVSGTFFLLKEQDYDKYARKMKKYLKWELIILDDFLLHTITDEREIKILFELLEKRNEQRKKHHCMLTA